MIYNEPILNSTTTTTTITFRITKQYEDYLRKKAEQERVSVNIIANRIFGEYIEWQQFIENLEQLNNYKLIILNYIPLIMKL